MSIHFVDNHYVTMEKGPLSDIRIRSRKATLSDCSRFLRPGIDICVLSAPQQSNDSDAVVMDPVSFLCPLNFIHITPLIRGNRVP